MAGIVAEVNSKLRNLGARSTEKCRGSGNASPGVHFPVQPLLDASP